MLFLNEANYGALFNANLVLRRAESFGRELPELSLFFFHLFFLIVDLHSSAMVYFKCFSPISSCYVN